MMRVLVTAASRHGATTEIADAIGAALREAGLETSVVPPDEVLTLAGYDAVVLGSAVYMGRWLDPAKQFAARNGAALAARPVWLFSCGPIGDPPKPTEEPVDVAGIREATGARDHRIFSGKLDRHGLGFGEKAIITAFRTQDGDFRPWDEIRDWSTGIVGELQALSIQTIPS